MNIRDNLPWFLGKDSQYTYVQNVPVLVLDFETTNLDKGSALNPDNRLVLACWRTEQPDGSVREKHKFGDEYEQDELLEDIKSVWAQGGFIVAHNLKFELQWLRRCGLELRDGIGFCTMLGQWVLDGNRQLPRNLEALAKRYRIGHKGGLVAALINAGVCPSQIKKDWLLKYCRQDVRLCDILFNLISTELAAREQLHLVHVRNLLAFVLADIEFQGMHLDNEKVQAEYEQTLAKKNEVEAQLYELTGGINLASPKQVGEFLFDKLKFAQPKDYNGKPITTGSGAPSVSATALKRLVAKTDQQKLFLKLYGEFNKYDSLLSKNLIFFKRVCDERGGKFFGSFNQGIAGTHRLTSSGRPIVFVGEKSGRGVQLQNLPRIYKGLFGCHLGDYLVGEADGAQLEFRVAAELGGDSVAYDVIAGDGDVHTDTATVFVDWNAANPDKPHPDFIGKDYKSGRQPAKSQTFKPLYGGQGNHPAEVEYCKFFKAKYDGIARTQHNWTLLVLNNKKLRTAYGMEFYWPDTKMTRSGYITNTTQIYNYPVQGFATAEIIPIALIHFWHRVRDRRILVFTTIHDSIGSFVHKDEVEAYKELSKQALTDDVFRFLREVYSYDFKVPLGVGVKVGEHWGQSDKEHIWNVWPDGHSTYKEK